MVNINEAGEVRIMLDDLTQHNIKQFKMVNQAVFPVQYVDAFYKDAQKSDIHFSKLSYFNDLVVGGVCFRLEDAASEEIGKALSLGTKNADDIKKAPFKRAYIMTFGVLTAYRRYGVGKKMLEWVIEKVKELKDVNGIFLHVQTNNDEAKQFYEKFDFVCDGGVHENYYKKIDPPDAYMLKLDIEATVQEIKDEKKEVKQDEKKNEKKDEENKEEKTEEKTEAITEEKTKEKTENSTAPEVEEKVTETTATSKSKKNKKKKNKK